MTSGPPDPQASPAQPTTPPAPAPAYATAFPPPPPPVPEPLQPLLPAPEWDVGRWYNVKGFRSARLRAGWLLGILVVEALLHAANTALYFTEAWLIDRFQRGEVDLDTLLIFDTVVPLVSLVVLVAVTIAGFVMTLAWLSRSVDNTPYLLGGTPKQSPGWSIGWWFIPFANLVMPYRVITDLDRRMARGITGPIRGFILAWWLFSIFAGAANNVVARALPLDTLEQIQTFALWAGITEIPLVVLPFLLFLIVRRIQHNADARLQMLSDASAAARRDGVAPVPAG